MPGADRAPSVALAPGNPAQAVLQQVSSLGPVIPVIVLERLEHALPMAGALLEGGVQVLEVTLRSPVALACIEAIAKAFPSALVGAGTVRSAADVQAAQAAGSRFVVSPGYSTSVAQACQRAGLALLPGVATAGEVMAAHGDGLNFLKFFPAAAAGGIPMLKALAGPFPDVSFCPTGGISAENAMGYLSLPNVKVVGGSWLVPSEALHRGDWAQIKQLAKQAQALRAA